MAAFWCLIAFTGGAFVTLLEAQPAPLAYPAEYRSAGEAAASAINLRDQKVAIPHEAAISALHLAHKPTKAARTAFGQGLRAKREQRTIAARQYFTQAVVLDPQYVEARAQLGVLYGQNRDPSAALEQFEIALAIEPNSEALHTDRAWCLILLKRPGEAEREARLALQLQPSAVEAHYLLALSLLAQDIVTAETVQHLRIASIEYEDARAVLALVKENYLEALRDQ